MFDPECVSFDFDDKVHQEDNEEHQCGGQEELGGAQYQQSDSDDKLIQLYVFFLLMFQSTFHISDSATNVLLKFLRLFLGTLAMAHGLPTLQSFAEKLPRSGSVAKSMYSDGGGRNIVKYVCCPTCFNTEEWGTQLLESRTLRQEDAKRCTFVQFPNHPQSQHRKTCNTLLVKVVKTPTQHQRIYPRLVYCYKKITDSLQEFLLRPGFINKCEAWRNRSQQDGTYRDVYDGQVWKDFQVHSGKQFLSLPFNFAFHINVDWFQPFEHTQHSEGAIYLSILNLPRELRYLQENVILVGVIPGPKEPKKHINSFLKPLVKELQQLWKGVSLKTRNGLQVLVRAALICVGCDIPAARKVCGFVGHSALRGCSKCLLSFPRNAFGEKGDYTNVNRSDWIPRKSDEHKVNAQAHKSCNTLTNQKAIERDTGVRYSVLNELPYFDPPRMCVIDPMHNMLLGTSKHMLEAWKTLGILPEKSWENIQTRVNSFVTPSDVGRIPSKIASGFSGFTAEQWKNWTIYFSLFSLKDVLPSDHYNCWHIFVKACFLLCRRSITAAQVSEADELLLEFHKKVVELYGNEWCTPNIHLHGHISECIKDFGPVYSFWLFAFERLNGILGSYNTNNRNISVQLMQRFLDSKLYAPHNWPSDYVNTFLPVLEHFNYQKGSLQQTTLETVISSSDDEVTPLPPINECAFSQNELPYLQQILANYREISTDHSVLMLYHKAKAIRINNRFVVGSKYSRYYKCSLVLAKKGENISLAEIKFFAECKLNSRKCMWVAAVNWLMEHPCKEWFGYPTQVWTTVVDVSSRDAVPFIPVSDIKSRVAYSMSKVDFGNIIQQDLVYVVSPLEYNT